MSVPASPVDAGGDTRSHPPSTGHRLLRRALAAVGAVVVAGALVVVLGLAAGYRPVIITTGSMGDTMPPGSLVIAAPQAGADIGLGDVVVMRRPGQTPVTHRVVELHDVDGQPVAVTRGDANAERDVVPYPLEGDQLVARWSIAGAGSVVSTLAQPLVLLMVATGLIGAGAVPVLRRIWRTSSGPSRPPEATPSPKRPRLVAAGSVAVLVATTGVGWALFRATDSVTGNTFSAGSCFEAGVTQVQSGTVANSANGSQIQSITAVDPSRSFLVFSVRSDSNEPADSMVRGRLAGPTTIEFLRQTDAGVAPTITIEWSVVEYSCGITVQRGVSTVAGAAPTLSIPIAAVDPQSSFLLASHAPPAASTDADGTVMMTARIANATSLAFEAASPTQLPVGTTVAWQVIEFDAPADATAQRSVTTLGAAATSATAALASPVDPETTFVLASVRSTATGVTIEDRLVEAHLTSPTTVAVSRRAAGPALTVHLQVVTLNDGSTVRHGTVSMTGAEATTAVTIDAVDPDRSTALSTVQGPASTSIGNTAAVGDDILGAGSATFVVTDPATVTLTRDHVTGPATWGWQVIEWGGPTWWDPQYPWRQRIDVDTTTDASPDGYSVPLTFDHQALVAAGLARSDGADLRVLRWDGTTWIELDRVLADGGGWDRADTTIWFRTHQAIAPDSRISYWMYYGDDTPTPPAEDPENVWLLYEDFESGTLGDFTDRTAGTGWYQADPWTWRVPVTVDATLVAADETALPIAVHITDPVLTTARTDGADLRFATTGGTLLPFEIEYWDHAGGELVAWVTPPTLSSSVDTTIHLYGGAPQAPDQQDPRSVYPLDAAGIWHFDRNPVGPSPHLDDRSTGHLDGLALGSFAVTDRRSDGIIGYATELDGDGDRFELPPPDLATVGAFTLSAWLKPDNTAATHAVATVATSGADEAIVVRTLPGGTVQGTVELDGSPVSVSGAAVTPGTWNHVALVWDGNTLTLRVRGQAPASTPATGSLPVGATRPLTFGAHADGSDAFAGVLDEATFAPVARSAAWFDTTGNNAAAPGFLTVGPVEVGTWFGQGTWGHRKPVAVNGDQVTGTVAGFPLLVQVTDADLAALARPDGADIVFTASDGTTRLAHEIEAFDDTTGTLTAWVLVPSLTAGVDEQLFMYFDNATAIDQQTPHTVFGPDYDGVWHLGG